MKVLYLGASLRMRLSAPAAPELRALGLKQGLEQAGFEVVTIMAGDELNNKRAKRIYSEQLKKLLPSWITNAMRDAYEILLDRQFYRIGETHVRGINPDVILQKHSRYGQVGVRLGQRYNIPVFLDDITPLWEGEQYGQRSLKLIARQLRKKVFSQASGLIAVSRDMEIRLQEEGIPGRKIHFVPNGVDCALFNPYTTSTIVRQKYGLTDKIVVGYIGGFQSWHRLDFLIQVASSLIDVLPNIHFILVGEDLDGRMGKIARENGLNDRFTFPGRVSHSEIPQFVNAMDIAILPSTLPYMSPMKIYEYMAMGKPVIAPNRNSITVDVVVPYQNGLLFEAEDAGSMQSAIYTLSTDVKLREKISEENRKSAQTNFTWYHQARNLIQAFQSASFVSVN